MQIYINSVKTLQIHRNSNLPKNKNNFCKLRKAVKVKKTISETNLNLFRRLLKILLYSTI